MHDLKQELQDFIDQHLPAVQRLEFAIEEASAERVILSAPLAANINDKLTAFGGSIQMLALACNWSLTYLNMVDRGLKEQQFVVMEVNTKYLRMVATERFYAMCERDEVSIDDFADKAGAGLSARYTGKSAVFASDRINLDNPAATNWEKAGATLSATFASIKL